MKNQPQQLTFEETAFAAEHHDQIYKYLNERELPEDEFYDVVVFGYLEAVHKYFEQANKQNSFTVLSRCEMDNSYASYMNSLSVSRSDMEFLSINERYQSAYLLEETISDLNDLSEDVISSISVKNTLNSFDRTERRIVKLLLKGYTETEIENRIGTTSKELHNKIFEIRAKLHNGLLLQAA